MLRCLGFGEAHLPYTWRLYILICRVFFTPFHELGHVSRNLNGNPSLS